MKQTLLLTILVASPLIAEAQNYPWLQPVGPKPSFADLNYLDNQQKIHPDLDVSRIWAENNRQPDRLIVVEPPQKLESLFHSKTLGEIARELNLPTDSLSDSRK